MPKEAGLFEAAGGSAIEGYFLLKKGGKNIPPNWIERSAESRKRRQKELGKLLQSEDLNAVSLLKEWQLAFEKENFYRGLRILLELERAGKSKL